MSLKYSEDVILDEVIEYIKTTYTQHYVGNSEGIQTIDLLDSIGIAEHFCQGSAIKYVSRYGKKGGYNKKDIMKAIHFLVLMLNFNEKSGKFVDIRSLPIPSPEEIKAQVQLERANKSSVETPQRLD